MASGIRTGLHFGLTSGVITTLGLIVGLHSGTHSQLAVIGGIVTIAVADAMSDALGVHIATEAEPANSAQQVWLATVSTFGTKLLTAASFLIPVLLLPLTEAIVVSVFWGLLLLGILSLKMARDQQAAALPIIGEHLGIALAVVAITHFVGEWVSRVFG